MAKVARRCPCFQPEEDDVNELDYCHCGLEDVPSDVFLYERTLEELYLDCNQIRDLPRPLFHCHGLKKLGLSDNEIQSLPPAIASLINLEKLDISKNGVVAFPDNIKGCKNLLTIEASINPLGKLPDGFTQLINLGELYLNDTFLDFLPANFGRLSKLKILELRENRLKALPKSMARLTELTRLDIGQNEFYELPEVVSSLCKLEELWCDDNEISHLPIGLQNLKNLTYLDASNNNIEWFAPEVCYCKNLVDLRITNNCLRDLPDTIGNLVNLVTFKVDDNYLVELPHAIGSLYSLEELVVSQNDLRTLPSSVGLLRKIHTLYVDENCLTDLPAELGSCTSLTILSLRDNKLIRIPEELGHLSRLRVMNLSNNQIQYLPFNITKLQELQALWLSDNQNKPLIPLQSDYDSRTGQRVLTCFLLPQQRHQARDGEVNNDGDSSHLPVWEEQRERKQQIKFASDDQFDHPGKLIRAPTPYPKELKAHAKHAKNQALKLKGPYPQSNDADIAHSLEVNPQSVIPLRSVLIQEAKIKVREAKVTKPTTAPNTQDLSLDNQSNQSTTQIDNERPRNFETTSLKSNYTSEDKNSDTNVENFYVNSMPNTPNENRHPLHFNVRQTQDNGKSDSSDSGCLSSVNYPRFLPFVDVNQGMNASVNYFPYNSYESPNMSNVIQSFNEEQRGSFKSDGSASAVPLSPSFEQQQLASEKCRRDSKSSYERPRQLSSLPNAAHPNLIGIVQRSSPPPSPTHVKTLELVNKMRAATPPTCRMPSPPPSPHRQTPPSVSNFGMFSPTMPAGFRRMSSSPPRICEQTPRTFSFSGPPPPTMLNPIMPRSAPSSPGQSVKYQNILTSNHVALTPTANRRPMALYLPSARDKAKVVLNRLTPSPPRCLPPGKENVSSSPCFVQRSDGMPANSANVRLAQNMTGYSQSSFPYQSPKMRSSPTNTTPPMEHGFTQPLPSNPNVVSGNVMFHSKHQMNAMTASPIMKPPAYHIAAAYSRYPEIVADNINDRSQAYKEAAYSYNVASSPVYYSGYPRSMYNDGTTSDMVYKHPLPISQQVALPIAENVQVQNDYNGHYMRQNDHDNQIYENVNCASLHPNASAYSPVLTYHPAQTAADDKSILTSSNAYATSSLLSPFPKDLGNAQSVSPRSFASPNSSQPSSLSNSPEQRVPHQPTFDLASMEAKPVASVEETFNVFTAKLALVDQTGLVDDGIVPCSSSSSNNSNPQVLKPSHPTNFTQDKPSCTNGLPLIVPTPHRPLGAKYANVSGSRKGSWVFGPHRNPQVFPVIILKNPGLGFSIVEGTADVSPGPYSLPDTAVFVASVEPNGPASTALKSGDKILEMNGVDFTHIDYDKAVNMLQNCGPTISLMVSRD